MDNGITIPSWDGRRATAALDKVRARGRRNKERCCICDQPIDYDLRKDEMACSVQHVKSRIDYPELTWVESNWKPAHLACNKRAGARQDLGLGITSI